MSLYIKIMFFKLMMVAYFSTHITAAPTHEDTNKKILNNNYEEFKQFVSYSNDVVDNSVLGMRVKRDDASSSALPNAESSSAAASSADPVSTVSAGDVTTAVEAGGTTVSDASSSVAASASVSETEGALIPDADAATMTVIPDNIAKHITDVPTQKTPLNAADLNKLPGPGEAVEPGKVPPAPAQTPASVKGDARPQVASFIVTTSGLLLVLCYFITV